MLSLFRWKNLIESSCRWSLELYHNNEVDVDEPWIDFMLATNRKFGTIKLNQIMFIDNNKTLEIFQKHGFNVVKLWLIGSCIDSFIRFAEVLHCMPNLQHVVIFETSTMCSVSDAPPELDLPNLSELKTLELVGSEYSIVKCFQKAKLTTIKVLNSSHDHSLDSKPFEDFLKSQEMLTKLAFHTVHHDTSTLFRTENLNSPMPFHLTQLSLQHIRLQESPDDYNNLLKFLKPQAKTMKILELGRSFPSFVLEFVFANMTKLHTLSLLMNELPEDETFYERLEENRSVKDLIFLDSIRLKDSHLKCFCDFLQKLPNICNLKVLEYCGNLPFLLMAENLPKIETLTTYSFNEDIFHGVQFPNLKTLEIEQLDDKIDWNTFTKANSQLTELTIQNIFDASFLNHDDIESITSNLNLQSLRLGENFSADERFFEIIRNKCPNIKVLDLAKSCLSIELTDQLDWSVLRLCDGDFIKCSKYLMLWNEDDYDGRLQFDENVWNEGEGEGILAPFDINLMGIDFDYDDLLGDEYDYFNDYGQFGGGVSDDSDY